jgi:hypothetical protein
LMAPIASKKFNLRPSQSISCSVTVKSAVVAIKSFQLISH